MFGTGMFGTGMFGTRTFGRGMFSTALRKKRAVGLVLFVVLLSLFLWFNRIPKLDTVQADLVDATAPAAACFQGFCVDNAPGSTLFSRWWDFSLAYLELVSLGMVFAFLIAGLTEVFLFPSSRGAQGGWAQPGIRGSLRGLLVGSAMNLCSACIVPISSAFRRRGAGLETSLAIVQGSATLNLPALLMAAMVFTPMLAGSRVGLSLVGALLLGPLVARLAGQKLSPLPDPLPWDGTLEQVQMSWGQVLTQGCRDWLIASAKYLLRLGPLMVVAGFAGALAIQWVSPQTVSTYLGDNALGVVIAATLGLLINVPLLFEIPLVAALLLVGMGTAPAAVLLFAAAAGGPVTFWGLARVMPKRVVATFATATWGLAAVGGLAILALGPLIGGEEPIFSDVSERADAGFHLDRDYRDIVLKDDVGLRSGVLDFDPLLGGGIVVFDYDGDGNQDIYVTSTEGMDTQKEASSGHNALFRNNGDGTFTNVAAASGVRDVPGISTGGCAADYDNDGDQDLFVANWGSSKLFQNNGNGTFTDVTGYVGLEDPDTTYRSMGCAWGDYDQDGFLDFVLVRYFDDRFFVDVRPLAMHNNNGDGTFTEVTYLLSDTRRPTGISGKFGNVWGAGYQPGWLDFDSDGDLDLYVVNDQGQFIQPNVLWRNDGPGPDGAWEFVDISAQAGADTAMFGMAMAVADYDLDGNLDIFMTNIGNNVLLKGVDGGLSFTDTAAEAGVAIGSYRGQFRISWGAVFFDYDNSGWEDLYVASGYLDTGLKNNSRSQSNVLLHNNGDGTFIDKSAKSGAADPGIGRGVAYLDFNNDGCLDIYLTNLGVSAQLPDEGRLFQNSCNSGNNWLVIDTVGTVSNRDGIGARIKVSTGEHIQIREVTSGSSSLSQNMLPVHFGLGRAKIIDSIEIVWPSGVRQIFANVDPNQRLTVTEPRPPSSISSLP